MNSTINTEAAKERGLDSAAMALWLAFPDGPPADAYEPPEEEHIVAARMTALKSLGACAAVLAMPHLFPARDST